MTRILAIDPGNVQSAWVVYERFAWEKRGKVLELGLEPNETVLYVVKAGTGADICLIEQVRSFGMAVGQTVFDTIWWAGRFAQARVDARGQYEMVPRMAVKTALCHDSRAKDANIRQALIDRFGPSRQQAMGTKKSPGPLYGVKKDIWSALAIAVAWSDERVGAARIQRGG